MKRTNHLQNCRLAFTLIELLVVIAIIAILAAILFPVFARARENARRSSCASNMRQIGLGVMQYTQDYDEFYPLGSSASGDRGNGWAGQIYSYIKSSQVFTCPSDSSVAGGQNLTISYAMNQSIVWAAPTCSVTSPPSQLSAFNAPTLTTMFFEVENCVWFPRDDAPKPGYTWITSPTGNGMQNNLMAPQSPKRRYATGIFSAATAGSATDFNPEPRHLQGSNYIFADGHVKWMKATSISPGLAAPSPTTPAVLNTGCYNAAGTETLGNGLAATFSPR